MLIFALVASAGTLFAESGTLGDNATWNYADGVLTISGTGAMTDFANLMAVPWNASPMSEIIPLSRSAVWKV